MATGMTLQKQISGEIRGDELSNILQSLAMLPEVKTVLEIGAGSGEGSTVSLTDGMAKNPNPDKRMFSIEASTERAEQVARMYAHLPFVSVYNGCSISGHEYATEHDVKDFYSRVKSALNQYTVSTILQWLNDEIVYIMTNGIPQNVIQQIKQENDIETFDLVLLDGSEFTGRADLKHVIGAKYIVMDDVNAFKNRGNYNELIDAGSNYRLVAEDWRLRNGYAVFKHNG